MIRVAASVVALALCCLISAAPARADNGFHRGVMPRHAFVPNHPGVFFPNQFHNRVFFHDNGVFFHDNRAFFHDNRVFFRDPFFFQRRHPFFHSFVFFGTPIFAPLPIALFPPPAFPAYLMAPIPDQANCYQYETTIFLGGQPQPAVGTACLGADGFWHVMPY